MSPISGGDSCTGVCVCPHSSDCTLTMDVFVVYKLDSSWFQKAVKKTCGQKYNTVLIEETGLKAVSASTAPPESAVFSCVPCVSSTHIPVKQFPVTLLISRFESSDRNAYSRSRCRTPMLFIYLLCHTLLAALAWNDLFAHQWARSVPRSTLHLFNKHALNE